MLKLFKKSETNPSCYSHMTGLMWALHRKTGKLFFCNDSISVGETLPPKMVEAYNLDYENVNDLLSPMGLQVECIGSFYDFCCKSDCNSCFYNNKYILVEQ